MNRLPRTDGAAPPSYDTLLGCAAMKLDRRGVVLALSICAASCAPDAPRPVGSPARQLEDGPPKAPSASALVVPLPSQTAATTPGGPRAETDPEQAVQELLTLAIGLLERGEDAKLIDEHVAPSDREELLRKPRQELLAEFRRDKADRLLAILRALRGARPTRAEPDDEGLVLRYAGPSGRGVEFVVIDGRAFLKN